MIRLLSFQSANGDRLLSSICFTGGKSFSQRYIQYKAPNVSQQTLSEIRKISSVISWTASFAAGITWRSSDFPCNVLHFNSIICIFGLLKGKVFPVLTNSTLHYESVCGSGCINPHFLVICTSWRRVVSFTPLPLYPLKWPLYLVDKRPDQTTWKRENSLPYRDSNIYPQVSKP
jgi:hypothetical protein